MPVARPGERGRRPSTFYGDVLDVWRPWAGRVSGQAMPTSHFIVEDEPEQTADVLSTFFDASPSLEANT